MRQNGNDTAPIAEKSLLFLRARCKLILGDGTAGIGVNSLGAIQNPGSPAGRLEGSPVQGVFASRPIPAANIGLGRGTLLSLRCQLRAMPGSPSCLLGSLLLVFAFRGSWTSWVTLPSAFRSLASTGAKHCDARRAERLGRSGGRGQRPAARRLALAPRGARDFVPRSPSVTDDCPPRTSISPSS